jgi:hypothetical protein
MEFWQAEIVIVADKDMLMHTNQEAYTYRTRYGTALDPGHYLLLTEISLRPKRQQCVVYFGPFASECLAKILLKSSGYFGLLTAPREEKIQAPTDRFRPAGPDRNLPVLLRWRADSQPDLSGF